MGVEGFWGWGDAAPPRSAQGGNGQASQDCAARPLRGAPPDWRCYADASGRQGWLAHDHEAAQPGTIRFPLLLHGDNATVSTVK